MANSKISQLSSLTGSVAASNDVLPIVDVSDSTMAATGTTKKITLTELQSAPVGAGTANGVLYLNGSKVPTAGSGLVFDPSGNLGLGVTPSASWTGKAFQLGAGAFTETTLGGEIAYNAIRSGATSWVGLATGNANRFSFGGGAFAWHTGTAVGPGGDISFTQAMTLDASGSLLVGKTSSSGGVAGVENHPYGLVISTRDGGFSAYFNRLTSDGDLVSFNRSNTQVGSVSVTTSATAYNTSSDYRLKDNQQPLTGSGEFIDALKPKTWDWKADGSRGVGFIAHEVQEVSPTSVVGEKDATRIEQYEISPAVPAVLDEEGNVVTPAVEAVMGEREVPAYQAMEYGSSEFIANIVAELQSLRKRVAALEAGGI